jgi:hypothetical protein
MEICYIHSCHRVTGLTVKESIYEVKWVNNYVIGKKKASYTAEIKLKVVLYAEGNEKWIAAQQIDVDPKCVHMVQ